MTMMIEAVYDGKVFLPTGPLTLAPNTRVKISIETDGGEPFSFLGVAQSLKLDGPPDWSAKLDEYLYGGKRINGI
ncbi:MAG: antitoxin family protein [Caldilineaceae bacterium]